MSRRFVVMAKLNVVTRRARGRREETMPARPAPTMVIFMMAPCPVPAPSGAVRSLAQRVECTEFSHRPDTGRQLGLGDQRGRQLVQRHQDEGPLVEARVGNEDLGVTARLVAHEEHVDVQRAWSPSNLASALRGRFRALGSRREFSRAWRPSSISTTMFQKSSWATPPTGSLS